MTAAGRILRDYRESRGLSLRDLARETRITIPVLEAIERGWSDRLPEHAYLSSMLPLLEQHLDMPPGCLSEALPGRPLQQDTCERNNYRWPKIDSVDVFTTWRGNVIYGIIMLATLYSLNQQQRQLAASNILSLQPIPLSNRSRDARVAATSDNFNPHRNLSLHGNYQQYRPADTSRIKVSSTRVLQLMLREPRQLQISSAGRDHANLQTAQGNLMFQLQGPLELTIRPPLRDGDRLIWDGRELPALANRPTSNYWLGQPQSGDTSLQASDPERSQALLRSP